MIYEMEKWSKNKVLQLIATHVDRINELTEETGKEIDKFLQENLEYVDSLLEQIPASASCPLISKTPKVLRKKNLKRIETIPEDGMVEIDHSLADSKNKFEEREIDIVPSGMGRRSRREASKKAGDIIKQQQSISLSTKLRRPSDSDQDCPRISKASSCMSRSKRLRSIRSSDEDHETKRPSKQLRNESPQLQELKLSQDKEVPFIEPVNNKVLENNSRELCAVKRKLDSSSSKFKHDSPYQKFEPESKRANIIDETLEASCVNDTIESTMYEDALSKDPPMMNSTMKPISPLTDQTCNLAVNETRIVTHTLKESQIRMMNTTVVIGRMNETYAKNSEPNSNNENDSKKNSISNLSPQTEKIADKQLEVSSSAITKVKKNTEIKREPVSELDSLMTDDDSSPERKLLKKKRMLRKEKKVEQENRPRKITRSSLISEDGVDLFPKRKILGETNERNNKKDIRNVYKSSALFSPYAKESVRKRVEAFEQAGLGSPAVETDSEMRLTRTKTRAMAAANDHADQIGQSAITIAQKLARRSLAKAKQISRAKQTRDNEEVKETDTIFAQKSVTKDKALQKQQLRTTPNSKIRPQISNSASKYQTTPSNSQSLASYTKAITGSRTNIVTNVDSFIQPKGSAQKPTPTDKVLEEKKRRQQEEDARKKRDEALRAQIEEKKRRREEKERKNRLAREAKEKLELEKRLKAEKDREEKARLALLAQERQKEEAEKKKLAQLQRAQEKEERRKQEELQRLQKLQEQEEIERQLAEQRRREQEIERRKQAEVKAQQTHADNMKLKIQMLAAQAKKQNKCTQPTNYKIDSEPDSDSDDELKPKHEIPAWAKPHYRQRHLAMQEYVPMRLAMKLFMARKCSPDLSELFQGIDKKRLKRTSSAIWKTPPRYSKMSFLEEMN